MFYIPTIPTLQETKIKTKKTPTQIIITITTINNPTTLIVIRKMLIT